MAIRRTDFRSSRNKQRRRCKRRNRRKHLRGCMGLRGNVRRNRIAKEWRIIGALTRLRIFINIRDIIFGVTRRLHRRDAIGIRGAVVIRIPRFMSPGKVAVNNHMMRGLTEATQHVFRAILRTMTTLITVKTNNFNTFFGNMTNFITFSAHFLLTGVV